MSQITPTGHAKAGVWTGTRIGDQQLTEEQKTKMILLRGTLLGWDIRPVSIKVPREPTEADRACCRPREECFDVRDVDCPIIARGSQKDTIVTPGGDTMQVMARKK